MDEIRQITQDEAFKLALEYQKTNNEAIFAMLLAKYDELLLATVYEYRKKNRYTYRDPLQELYHIAILGFAACIKSIPATEQSCKMPCRIKEYVKTAFQTAYRAQNVDHEIMNMHVKNGMQNATITIPCAFHNVENKLDIAYIMKHVKLLKRERKILRMRYIKEMKMSAIQKYYKLSRAGVRKQLKRAFKKINAYISKGGKQ